jgi:hypothetical protein
MLTHLTWSTLMVHFLPPLFTATSAAATAAPGCVSGSNDRSLGRSDD